MNRKELGSYYTPQLLADYIVYRLFDEGGYSFDSNINVLEPSVGGGIFLDALFNDNHYRNKGLFNNKIPHLNIDAVEVDRNAAVETKKLVQNYNIDRGNINIINENYLTYFLNTDKKYDLIIGNPPYVRRRSMSLELRNQCADVHERVGLKDRNPKNLWTSFFAGAKSSLTEDGVIAFILPADLMQVKYSQEIREILQKDFKRVEIFTLNWIYFDDIEQDVVILFCTNQGNKTVPRFIHIDNLGDLEKPKHYDDHDNSQRTTLNKWTNYVLSNNEFKFLDYLYNKKIMPETVRYYCDSGAGIVTAANDYYIVNKQVVDNYSLADIAKLTIKKSSSMFPAVTLSLDDLKKKENDGVELFFLDFPDKPKKELPQNYLTYLQMGEEENIHQRYKMLLRNNWYAVPSIWSSEAFFTKRSNIYPRIIVNEADAYVTDAFYRIRMKKEFNEKNLSFSFFNTFTFIYSELMGRYYGGGVLELTPNEFKDLPIPYIKKSVKKQLEHLDKLVRAKKRPFTILNYTDKIILQDNFGLTDLEVTKLREIYTKLIIRRMKKENTGL